MGKTELRPANKRPNIPAGMVSAPFGLDTAEPSDIVGMKLTHGQLEAVRALGEIQF